MREQVTAHGHENVTAAHESTLELTSDDFLTPAGDCILGIEADRVPADFDESFVDACQDESVTITATLAADGHTDTVVGHGHPEFSFNDARSLVIRTSDYVDNRTVMIGADAAACDIDRDLVDALSSGAELTLTLTVE